MVEKMGIMAGNIVLLLVLPLVMAGVIRRVKAFWGGRKGPCLRQPFFDLVRLLRKGEVIGSSSTWVSRAAPTVSLAAIVAAACLVPLAGGRAIISFDGDFVVFAYLLALSRFSLVLAGLDAGSSFEGMGCSREVIFAALVEPGFFMIMAALAGWAGTPSFAAIMAMLPHSVGGLWIINVLAAIGLLIMMLAEGSRVPVDDPATHLELTMIHEVMVLDYSGPDLAYILYGTMVKMFLIGALAANVLFPTVTLPWGWAAAVFLAAIPAEGVLVGMIESLMARLRLSHVPQFLFVMPALGLTLVFIVIMAWEKMI
ncbi:MAG: NADH-quinone oxidoreductase subunit H [Victivallales bacterium]|nr:NADH-quinone oxidoreductase subunit H [Victivallales bacterium]